jgi:hypothetical protein
VLAVGCCDVVLDEDGDTGERAAVRRLLAVAQRSDGERVLIDLAHRVEARPGAVTAFDLRDRHNVFSPALNRLRHIQRLPPSDHSVDASDLEGVCIRPLEGGRRRQCLKQCVVVPFGVLSST